MEVKRTSCMSEDHQSLTTWGHTAGSCYNDMWVVQGNLWVFASPSNPPPPRQGHFAGACVA